jgi:hypothetical protein
MSSLFVFDVHCHIRFWQFRKAQRNPPCGVIIFEMQNLNVIAHEMFGNELGRIPPSAMWLV